MKRGVWLCFFLPCGVSLVQVASNTFRLQQTLTPFVWNFCLWLYVRFQFSFKSVPKRLASIKKHHFTSGNWFIRSGDWIEIHWRCCRTTELIYHTYRWRLMNSLTLLVNGTWATCQTSFSTFWFTSRLCGGRVTTLILHRGQTRELQHQATIFF